MLGQIQLIHEDGQREMLEQFTIGEVDILSLVNDLRTKKPNKPHNSYFALLIENDEHFIPVVSDLQTPF